jgi:tetratricopeptide (TPR) repeat protein
VYLAEYAKALADVLVKAHRPSEALDLYHRDLEVVEKSGNGPETAAAQTGLGVALIGLGRAPEALMLLDAALQWREANDPNQRELADTRFGVARALVGSRGDRARARSLAVRAVEGYSADPGALDDRRVAEAWLADLEGGAADRPANADSGVILRGLRRPDGSHGARP